MAKTNDNSHWHTIRIWHMHKNYVGRTVCKLYHADMAKHLFIDTNAKY